MIWQSWFQMLELKCANRKRGEIIISLSLDWRCLVAVFFKFSFLIVTTSWSAHEGLCQGKVSNAILPCNSSLTDFPGSVSLGKKKLKCNACVPNISQICQSSYWLLYTWMNYTMQWKKFTNLSFHICCKVFRHTCPPTKSVHFLKETFVNLMMAQWLRSIRIFVCIAKCTHSPTVDSLALLKYYGSKAEGRYPGVQWYGWLV